MAGIVLLDYRRGKRLVESTREPDAWKVRWCGVCRRYEYDSGSPRGWIPLRGDVPESVRKGGRQ